MLSWVPAPCCLLSSGVYAGVMFTCLRDPKRSHAVWFLPMIDPYERQFPDAHVQLEGEVRKQAASIWTRAINTKTFENLTLTPSVQAFDRNKNLCCHVQITDGKVTSV